MRKRISYAIAASVMAAFILSGCADPAEKTPDAIVADAQGTPPAEEAAAAPAEETAGEPMEEAAPADAAVYTFSPDSSIEFVGSKVTGSHTGGFAQFSGAITLAGEDLTQAKIESSIDMTSVHSDADGLTKHLMSADFFEVETYPEATFVSTSIAPKEGGYMITGDFTLHGVTKSIGFPATITMADGTITANAEFDINRKDFGIEYPGKPDDLIRDNVVIKLSIQASSA